MINYYAVLGVHKRSTSDEIRVMFRSLAADTHPDKVVGKEEEFKQLAIAKRILMQARVDYDRKLAVLGTKCERCSGTGTRSKIANWSAATLVPCKDCMGCGYINLPVEDSDGPTMV